MPSRLLLPPSNPQSSRSLDSPAPARTSQPSELRRNPSRLEAGAGAADEGREGQDGLRSLMAQPGGVPGCMGQLLLLLLLLLFLLVLLLLR